MTQSVDIVNRALAQIASQQKISAFVGTSPEQIAASTLYVGAWQLMAREMSPEFARSEGVALVPFGAVLPPHWSQCYSYPDDCLRLLQVLPPTYDIDDPQPVPWSVGNIGAANHVIMTNQAGALATFITTLITEDQWDQTFTEAVVRYLASELAMPIGGRPDFARQKLVEAGQLMSSNDGKDS